MPAKKTVAGLMLIPLMCAAVLWLAACGEGDPCTRGSSELVSRVNVNTVEFWRHLHEVGPAMGARYKHRELLWRQPNVVDVGTGFHRDGKGGWTDVWGISVWVTEKVDQATLPPEDRIPDYLGDVPVQIIDEDPLPSAAKSACDYDTCGANPSEKGGSMEDLIHHVLIKYDPLFWRQPNIDNASDGRFWDEKREETETVGIIVKVRSTVDQRALPLEHRIPDCLEGVPVQIRNEVW